VSTLLLVRHGETAWNREGRVQGWAPTRLTNRGRAQARALGTGLAADYDVDRLLASDLRRARETATLASEAGLDRDPTFDRRWRERDVGVYQGLLREDVLAAEATARDADSAAAIEDAPESGESLAEHAERVVAAFTDLLDALDDGETAVVVTHGGSLRLAVGHVEGLAPLTALERYGPKNCGVWTVDGRARSLDGQNETYAPG
jgi:probable phosphoglycerate mutase